MMKRSQCKIVATFAAALALFAASGPGYAAEGAPKAVSQSQNRVQLQVFQVKVVDDKGRTGQMPVTVYIDVPNRKASTDVYAVAPRLRDALNTHLRKETYKLDAAGNVMDLPAISAKARPVVEGAVNAENVAGVEIKQGAPAIKASAASMFQKSGCIGTADAVDEPKGAPKAPAEHH